MKTSEAVACGQRFKCPHNGCEIRQKFMSLTRHLILFHKWPHSSIDNWREKLTEADFDGVAQSSDRKGGVVRKKITPPPPKEKPVIQKHGTFNNGGSSFTLGDVVRFA